MTTIKRKTESKIIGQDRVTIEYCLEDLGQGPYFAITGEVRNKYAGKDTEAYRGGQVQHDYIRQFANVARFNKWHLCSLDNGPMHYVANALYHARTGKRDYLLSTIVYGALPDDLSVDPMALDQNALKAWLIERQPALVQAFHADMIALFGPLDS